MEKILLEEYVFIFLYCTSLFGYRWPVVVVNFELQLLVQCKTTSLLLFHSEC